MENTNVNLPNLNKNYFDLFSRYVGHFGFNREGYESISFFFFLNSFLFVFYNFSISRGLFRSQTTARNKKMGLMGTLLQSSPTRIKQPLAPTKLIDESSRESQDKFNILHKRIVDKFGQSKKLIGSIQGSGA